MCRQRLIFPSWLVILITLADIPAWSQAIEENNFVRYTTQQGLSHNTITGIAQDSVGYMWVATASGLNRYNGSQFIQFHSSNDSTSLPAEYLTDIVWLDRRRLAVCGNGVHIIDTYTGEKRNLFVPYEDRQYQYKFNFIIAVSSNAAGHMFVLTRSGFYHYDNQYKLLFRYDYLKKENVPTSGFGFGRELCWANSKQLLIVSRSGLFSYDVNTMQFALVENNDFPLLNEFLDYPKRLYKFFQPKPGRFMVLIPFSDSLLYIDLDRKIKTVSRLPYVINENDFHYRSRLRVVNDTTWYLTNHESGFHELIVNAETGVIQFPAAKYFPSYYCKAFVKDRDQNLWVATNRGLFRQDNALAHIQRATIPSAIETTIPNIVVDDVCVTGTRLFVGTRGYGGVLVYDKKSLALIRRIQFDPGKRQSDNIYAISEYDKDHVLVGSAGPLYKLNQHDLTFREFVPTNWVRNEDWISELYKDKKGNTWVASSGIHLVKAGTDTFSLVTTTANLFNKIHMAMHIEEDNNGDIWLAGHGICRYNVATNKFDKLIDSFPYVKMPDKQVNAIVADRDNNIWIANYNNGLSRYNLADKTFKHFTRDDGLPDNNIAAIKVVGNQLWVAGYSGIACMDMRNFKITSFGKEDGFPDMPIVQGTRFFYDSAQHELYIGFSNAVVRFNPDSLLLKSPAPRLFFESLAAGNHKNSFLPGNSFAASWQNNEITVTIGSINFFNSTGQRFAYRILKKGDERWQPLGARNTFAISNLAPGQHRIQVKLYSADNRWPEQVKDMLITITPPFWQQTWFRVAMGILLLLGVYGLVKWQTNVARKKEQINTNIQELKAAHYKNKYELEQVSNYLAEAQLSALQTQMNPHFIFNALNSIKRMILDNQQQKASRYLSKFAQMIRLTLNQSKEIVATLQENIEYLERYLEMEKLRFDDSFTFQIEVGEGVDEEEALIPTLMIQPLVENAIWHGLMHKEGEKKLYISFTRQGDTLVCMIEDNGIGIHQSKKLKQGSRPAHRSMGLDNLHNRIMIMNEKYEAGCRLDITDMKDIDKSKSGTLAVLSFNIVNNKLKYESIAG